MQRLIVATSLAHLLLFSAYIRLGAIDPLQARPSLFAGGFLWVVTVLAFVFAPFVGGAVLLGLNGVLKRVLRPRLLLVRHIAFIALALFGVLNLAQNVVRLNES